MTKISVNQCQTVDVDNLTWIDRNHILAAMIKSGTTTTETLVVANVHNTTRRVIIENIQRQRMPWQYKYIQGRTKRTV
jgi:hypothetical protein